jgi:alanyl-tRNA synthetase
MQPLIDVVVDGFAEAYPELKDNIAFVRQVAGSEEERFSATLRQGMRVFDDVVARAPAGSTVAGDEVFKLFDTFGFPPQLTEELLADRGLDADMERFTVLMDEQRERARRAAKKVEVGVEAGAVPPTEFVGYDRPEAEAEIAALLDADNVQLDVAEEGQEVRVFLARTPFYAEAGGQVGDRGQIRTHTGSVRVRDTLWAGPTAIMHVGEVESGEIRAGQDAIAEIDRMRRAATARAHTSTHVIHWTLKNILGDHARQAGSLVAPGRLRFDFPNPSGVPAEILEEAELEANRRLARNDAPNIFETSMAEAKRLGAVMLFDEKYGETVRVVEIGDYSRELCGGTHVDRTGSIGLIRILHEGSIGSGMRRIEALVGPDALREINVERELLRQLAHTLGSKDPRSALERAQQVVEDNRRLRGELGKMRAGGRDDLIASLADEAQAVDGVALVVREVPGEDPGGLRELAQKVRDRLGDRPGVVVLGNSEGGKAMLVAACTGAAVDRGVTAPEILQAAARVIGGGAGGKDILANAGGPEGAKVPDALGTIPARLGELTSRD